MSKQLTLICDLCDDSETLTDGEVGAFKELSFELRCPVVGTGHLETFETIRCPNCSGGHAAANIAAIAAWKNTYGSPDSGSKWLADARIAVEKAYLELAEGKKQLKLEQKAHKMNKEGYIAFLILLSILLGASVFENLQLMGVL